jgi:N-acetylmuramoyl-L-alanine amidase
MNVGVKEIRKWHKAKGWADIGYHFVIRRSGEVEAGRRESLVGAHAPQANGHSVAVCMVGGVSEADFTKAEDNFTPEQYEALKTLLRQLMDRYSIPADMVLGHRDLKGVAKACPSFDVRTWMQNNGF